MTLVARLNQALAGRYTVERELGAGGMATVFVARDLKHGREVALKVLRVELAAVLGAERFLREIRITAGLDHPHILTLIDSGEADGLLYYVLPLVRGESLRTRLAREKQLPVDEAVALARQIAGALHYAHNRGVIHRDIKPENILIHEGEAVVADFGIALAVREAGGDRLTQTGFSVGTPQYMSPEQATGDREIDARSDVYSLGAVLYEMLTGEPPHTGTSAQAVISRLLTERPTPLRVLRANTPRAVEAALERALAKTPADRFRSAAEFAASLTGATPTARRWPFSRRATVLAAVAVAALALGVPAATWLRRGHSQTGDTSRALEMRRIAVLDFTADTPDSTYQFLADGLTSSLITELSQVPDLRVISRNGTAPYRNTDLGVDSVARLLAVGTVVAGAIARDGDKLRVDLRVVDGQSGQVFRRASFTRPAPELLALRDSLTAEVARLLREWLGAEIRVRESAQGTTVVAAWSALQQAERARRRAEALLKEGQEAAAGQAFAVADSLFARGEELDPTWADPSVGRATVTYRRARLLEPTPAAAAALVQVGLQHTEEALRRAPTNARALELRGTMNYYVWLLQTSGDRVARQRLFDGARADLEQAVRFDPRLASAYATLSHLYSQFDDANAVIAAQRAYEEDAYLESAPVVLWRLFSTLLNIGSFGPAERWCTEGARRFPRDYRFVSCQMRLLTTPATVPDVERAWALLARQDSLTPPQRREFEHLRGELIVGGVIGRKTTATPPHPELRDSALHVLARAHAAVTPEIDGTGELDLLEAWMRTLVDDDDGAIALLERFKARHPDAVLGSASSVSWWWQSLRNHPKYNALFDVR